MAVFRVRNLGFHGSGKPSLRSGIRELALEQSLGFPSGGGTRSDEIIAHIYQSKVFRQKREDQLPGWTNHQASIFYDLWILGRLSLPVT